MLQGGGKRAVLVFILFGWIQIIANAVLVDKDGNTELHLAVLQNDATAVQELIDNDNTLIYARNNAMETPLHNAAHSAGKTHCRTGSRNCFNIILLLVDAGADVHAKDKKNYIFLHHLFLHPSPMDPFQFLIFVVFLKSRNYGELFNAGGGRHGMNTPFHQAVERINITMPTLRLLHRVGVNFNAVGFDGYSILARAITVPFPSLTMLQDMVALGADIKYISKFERNILHLIVHWYPSREILAFAIDNGVDVNRKDYNGNTPLHLLVYPFHNEKMIEGVRTLVGSGANRSIRNYGGFTACDLAKRMDHYRDKEEVLRLVMPDRI